MDAMLFTIFITAISLVIVVGCLVAIVMSTSHGTAWLQSLWRRNVGTDDDRP
jgi:hypothetical protein